jgi:plastocyanin
MLMAAACAAALGCGSGGSDSSPTPGAQCTAANATPITGPVQLIGLSFVPACGRVAAGTLVTFANTDSMAHTVTEDSTPPAFDSGTLGPTATFPQTFASAGTVHIHCNLHAGMRMTMIVQ